MPAEVLEHVAGNDNALKCSLSRAGGGRRLAGCRAGAMACAGLPGALAALAGRGARVPAVQHEGGLAIGGNQGGVAGQKELARVLVPPGDIDGLAGVHV